MRRRSGRSARVLVAGAGFAGLAAARALDARGFDVHVIDARNRVGGRVWTIRDGFAGRQHAEAGADLIEADQTALLKLIRECRLATVPILRRGFAYYGLDRAGRTSVQALVRGDHRVWAALGEAGDAYKLSERRWDSAIARRFARTSVDAWLKQVGADAWTRRRFVGFRGLFLADPDKLSLLALVDFFADEPFSGDQGMSRIAAGNDRLATALADALRRPPQLETVLRGVRRTRAGVTATLDDRSGRRSEFGADYLVVTLPATTLRRVRFDPALPEPQQDAIARLRYGSSTRLLLQCEHRFWKRRGRALAFGSDQPFGAVWDGNEHQRGDRGILSFLAGGRASAELRALLAREGVPGLMHRLRWLGRPSPVIASRVVAWEHDPWARGGYAYFDSAFNPLWREWLARPAGNVVFAGEHTSLRWQGYMVGAIESGQRAAEEVCAMHA
jgi:monoamine oxidase